MKLLALRDCDISRIIYHRLGEPFAIDQQGGFRGTGQSSNFPPPLLLFLSGSFPGFDLQEMCSCRCTWHGETANPSRGASLAASEWILVSLASCSRGFSCVASDERNACTAIKTGSHGFISVVEAKLSVAPHQYVLRSLHVASSC